MDEIVKDFLIESNENLDRLDQELVKLESEPSSKELLASIFRTIHTIKGSCGFLGFARLEKLTHAGESLLSQLRDGMLTLNADVTTALLAMVDAVRQMLRAIQVSGKDGEEGYAPLVELLASLQIAEPADSPAPSCGNSPVAVSPSQLPDKDSGMAAAASASALGPAARHAGDIHKSERALPEPSHLEDELIESGASYPGRIVFAPDQLETEQHGEHEGGQHKIGVAARVGARSEEAVAVETRNPDAAV